MSSHRRRRRFARPPRDLDPAQRRKALQLCRQVAQALHLALAGCGDPVLNDLLVVDVRALPDSTRLRVAVQSATGASSAAALARLRQAAGLLRREVAAAIHRRRTPELVFEVV
ncbi:MAG: ribosome-binding factor A [Gemmataceae bacterium]